MTEAKSPWQGADCRPEPSGATRPHAALRRHAGLLAVLVAATVASFAPSLDNDFVAWDDLENLTENTRYRGLGWSEIQYAFTTFDNGHYMPLVWLSWGADYLLWGLKPFGYHLTNLILHLLNACLIYALGLELLGRSRSPGGLTGKDLVGRRYCALLAALLFALHPLRVESVVWATERKDLLSSTFYLLTVVLYLRGRGGRWVLPAMVYVLAVLSKVMVVSLPVVLLVLDSYPLGRLGGARGWLGRAARKVYLQKIPFVLAAGAATAVAPLAQQHVASMPSWEVHGLGSRLAVCTYGLVFYPVKMLAPWNLSPLYELHYPVRPLDTRFLLCGAVVLVAALAAYLLRRRAPALGAAALCYPIILMPVLGLVQNGPQMVADRYSYLACVGWMLLVCGGLQRLWGRRPAVARAIVPLLAIVVAALGYLSAKQSEHWSDTKALWTQALRVDPECGFCLNAMGRAVAEEAPQEAEAYYRQALRLNPNHADAHNNLGILLTERGHLGEALRHLELAVNLEPENGVMLFNYGNTLARAGRVEEAVAWYARAASAPGWNPPATLFNNWAYQLIAGGRYAEAEAQARRALRIDPHHAKAHYNLGASLLRRGRPQQALESFRAGVRCRPDEPEVYLYAARELARGGLPERAAEILRTGLRRLPDNPRLTAELSRVQAPRRGDLPPHRPPSP